MPEERLASGVVGLDEVLHGGLLPRRSFLVVGRAGTGKTILSLQFLLEGKRRAERVLYITLAEPAREIVRNSAAFGWRVDPDDLLDLGPAIAAEGPTGEDEYRIFPPSEVEQVSVWGAIYRAIHERRPQRLVIDSATQLRYLSTDEYQFRKHVLELVAFAGSAGCTTLLAFEPTELERETSVALAVDAVIRLRVDISANRCIGLRSLEVQKLRGSDYLSGFHPVRINHAGLVVFPHRIEAPVGNSPGPDQLSTGMTHLDQLLGGGLETGTSTLLTGPTGVGKTTIGTLFLATAVARGKRAVLYTFEESVESILARSRGLRIPLEAPLESRGLRIARVNAMELYPDEFLGMVRASVERDGTDVIMLDSLRGYTLAMEQFGTPVAHMHNLASYLNHRGVSFLMINEMEYLIGDLRASELGLSYLADNIILMRHVEHDGQLIKVIGCLKKRVGDFQPELRQLHLSTGEGIVVSEKLQNLRGILTGVPTTNG